MYSHLRRPRAQKDLAWEEFRRVVDQFPVLERVLLHGIGEPLLNRDLPRMIEHLKRRGATVLFNSNAITLGPRLRTALIDSGLDELRVSLDATTAPTYARIRGVDALDKVIANLEGLAEAKRRAGSDHPRVTLWFTALKDNIEEIPALVPLATRVGAAGINLQRLVYNGLGLATEEQSLFGRVREQVAPEVSLTPTHADRPWSACRRPFSLVYVTVHGNVLPCCIAPFITQHYDGIVLGNLFQQSLEELWWGEPYLRFRAAIQTAAPPEPCQGCGVKWSL
jgi:MoaA/NifB/PqqE/SkfB family radical SAM enzyme